MSGASLSSDKHLVLVAPNWLGDVIMAQPAMRAFAMNHNGKITICGKAWLADLLPFLHLNSAAFSAEIPHADRVVLFPNSFSSAWRAWKSGTSRRIGFSGQWRSPLLRPALTPRFDMLTEHHRDYYLDLAEQSGVPISEREVALSLPDTEIENGKALLARHGLDAAKTICVAPGAQFGGAKRYPSESYAIVMQHLSEAGWQLMVLGTAAEREIGEASLQHVRIGWNAAGQTSLREALQIIAATQILLCNDSGLMHVAAGMNKPVVAIFGATAPYRTRPSGKHLHLLYHPANCSPCLQRECTVPGQPCMANVTPELVLNECFAALEQTGKT